MGLELDGLMCNKDRDRQEEFCKAAFFCTLRCNRNDQKHLTAAFSVSLLERYLLPYFSRTRNDSSHDVLSSAMHRCLKDNIGAVFYYCTV